MNIHTLKTIELTEVNIPNSIAEKKLNKTKAFENLEFAKALHRKVRFAKPGEGEFSRELIEKEKELEAEILTTAQSAKLIGASVSVIMLKKKDGELPFEKIKGILYFKREDVLKLSDSNTKQYTENLLSTKQAAAYINMKVESFQFRTNKFKIPYVLKGKRNKMYTKEDLDQHLIDHPRKNMDI